ncbi:MAG: LAGLIDADG family homing endonuclease [Candidatus Hodarchaeota archaeon]
MICGKKTKDFLEWLKNQKQILSKKEITTKKESKDDWEILLEKWIIEADEKEIPEKIKKELIEKIRKCKKLRELNRKLIALLRKENLSENEVAQVKNLITKLKDMNPFQEIIFENLKAFENFYEKNIRWFQHRIKAERERFTRYLTRKVQAIKCLILEESEDLAEFISIMLGDGNIYIKNGHYSLSISFSLREKEYIQYVKNLIIKLFKISPQYSENKKMTGSSARLRITRKLVVQALLSKGLKAGDKLKNQVSVPEWIKSFWSFIIASLKGLIDTDGTISAVRKFKTVIINFSNASLPLVKDFKDMCEIIDLKTSKIIGPIKKLSKITGKVSKQYVVSIQAKKSVRKFIEVVKPKKWEFHGEEILKKIGKSYEEAFNYVQSSYNLKKALMWKELLEKTGSIKRLIIYLKNKGKFTPTEAFFKIWMHKLLGKEKYEEWLDYNSNILINKETNKIFQFPQKLRILLSKIIYRILINNYDLTDKEIFDILEIEINDSEILKRLNYLLSNLKTRSTIINYFNMLISFVRKVKRNFESKSPTNITNLKEELALPIHKSHIKQIIETLKKEII